METKRSISCVPKSEMTGMDGRKGMSNVKLTSAGALIGDIAILK